MRDTSPGLRNGAGNFPIAREKLSSTLGLDFINGDYLITGIYDGIQEAILFLSNKKFIMLDDVDY
jgi:hypothetical protein